MKKIVFSLLVLLISIVFVSCFSSELSPFNSKIVGYGVLQQKGYYCYVEINDVHYIVLSLIVKDAPTKPAERTESIESFVGKRITCFVSECRQNPQFVVGEKNEYQIKNLYQDNSFSDVVLTIVVYGSFILLIFFVVMSCRKHK